MWRKKIILKPDQVVEHRKSYSKGTLGQDDIEQYDVINSDGKKSGTVSFTECTSLKAPFSKSYHLVQLDAGGKSIVDTRW